MANPLQTAGAQSQKPPRFVPLWTNAFQTGIWLQRSPLRDPSTRVESLYYGGRQEALIDGVNIELTNSRTLARRAGNSAYSTATVGEAINSFYAFKQFSTVSETITVVADGLTQIYSASPIAIDSIFTKSIGAGQASLFGINNTLYVGDGVDQVAWNGIAGNSFREWGIAPPGETTLPVTEYAGTVTNVFIGGSPWANPTNAQGPPDGVYATSEPVVISPALATTTDYLQADNYGFGISGTIAGITVQIIGNAVLQNFSNPINLQVGVQLTLGGVPVGFAPQQMFPVGVGDVTLTFGSSTSSPLAAWGANLTTAAVNNNLGFQISFLNLPDSVPPTDVLISIDSMPINIYVTGGTVGSPTGSGSLTTTTGWSYVYEYANSASGAFSPATPPGSSTGAFTGKASVNVPVIASSDPQVNQIWVFRTTDGGATYFALPTNPYPNATATISDTSPDGSLNTFQLADVTGLNTPPPVGIGGMVFHMGRMWGFVNNVLYYASGPDLGNILGNPYEGWPPANFFTLPSKITKLVPTSVGLLIHTISDIYITYGNSSATAAATGISGLTVFYVAPFITGIGLRSQFALDVNGTTIYMFTADNQLLSLDPSSGVSEIGFPIGVPNIAYPQQTSSPSISLDAFNPANTYVTWHVAGSRDKALYVSDGSTGWFRCNTSQPPEGGFVWSPKANIVGGCGAVQSIETSPGVKQLLIGPNSPRTAEITETVRLLGAGIYTAINTFSSGNTITVTGTTNGGGVFNVSNSLITETGPTFFGIDLAGPAIPVAPDTGTAVSSQLGGGGPILTRNLSVFSDNGVAYPAKFTMGSIVLAYPGQIAEIDFITCDYNKVGTSPVVSVLLNEISGMFENISGYVHSDPPSLYGTTLTPTTLYANRHDFAQTVSGDTPDPIFCRHLQINIDYGATDTVQNELLSLTIYGSYWAER